MANEKAKAKKIADKKAADAQTKKIAEAKKQAEINIKNQVL